MPVPEDVAGLELAVLLGCLLPVGGWLGERIRVPTPLVLVVCGALAGTIPPFANVRLPPSFVLLLFLPALLYWESSNISWREIRRNLGTISASAVPLVLASAAVAAVVGAAFGLPAAVAIALGAIVAPTDATAIASVARRLPVRTLTVLRAESLINDGTALTLYAVAVPAALTGTAIHIGSATFRFVLSYLGGAFIGAAVALLVGVVRRHVAGTPLLEDTVSVLTPFAAYLPAERAHVSGVLAVVTAGLVFSRFSPRLVTVRARTQVHGFWQITSWLTTPPEVTRVVEDRLRRRSERVRSDRDRHPLSPPDTGSESELERELIRVQRTTVLALRNRGVIDEAVLRRMQGELDIAELRLLGPDGGGVTTAAASWSAGRAAFRRGELPQDDRLRGGDVLTTHQVRPPAPHRGP